MRSPKMNSIPILCLMVGLSGVLPDGNAAWALAASDARSMPPHVRCYVRYVWVMNGDTEDAREASVTWNRVSRSSNIYQPTPLGRDKLLVLRFDLSKTAPRERDLKEHLDLWENFQNDPQFSRLWTKDTIKFNPVVILPKSKRWIEKTCEAYVHTDGKTYTSKWVQEDYTPTVVDLDKINVIRAPSEVLNPEIVRELCSLTGSEAPIVSHPYFILRTLKSIRDDGLFKDLYGGLYYDLIGFKRGVKGKTDLDGIFESIGIVNAKKLFDDLRSDQKIAIFRSAVTGKPRAVSVFHSPSGRNGSGTVRISEDLKDASIDIGTHPLMNLLKRKFDGQELIFERPNGLHAFAALNGEGKLVDEVPFDIALDTTIPGPHSRRLETLSCAGCHGPNDGVQPLTNDAKKLLKYLIDGDVKNPDAFDANDRALGLYAGDPTKLLFRVRDDYAASILAATGPWPSSKEAQADIVRLEATKLLQIRKEYFYDTLDAKRVLIDLRVEPGDSPVETLKERLLVNPNGLEDVRIAALIEGMSIGRFEYDMVRDFLAVRVLKKKEPSK